MVTNPTILIVDQNSVNRAVLYDSLISRKYRVLVAESGNAAVEITSLVSPQVILMDTDLPGIDGFEACRQIKSQPRGKDISILFVSAHNNNEYRTESFKAGGQAFLPKPVLYDEVYTLVETHLKLQEYKQQLDSGNQTQKQGAFEMDAIIDLIAHDINNPLLCILGFVDEFQNDFDEIPNIPEHWFEYLSIFKKCSNDINVGIDALVLLKNLRNNKALAPEEASLAELIVNASDRYNNLDSLLPLELEQKLEVDSVLSDPALLEELLLMIWRTFNDLNAETDSDRLKLTIRSALDEHGMIQLAMSAPTRPISSEELPIIFEPMNGNKRQKVKDTSIVTVCIQKTIEYLAINAWAEQTGEGLEVKLCLTAAPETAPTS